MELELFDMRFERVTEETATKVAESKYTIISLKQRCMALQSESKFGKQNTKKRNVKLKWGSKEHAEQKLHEYIKDNLVGTFTETQFISNRDLNKLDRRLIEKNLEREEEENYF